MSTGLHLISNEARENSVTSFDTLELAEWIMDDAHSYSIRTKPSTALCLVVGCVGDIMIKVLAELHDQVIAHFVICGHIGLACKNVANVTGGRQLGAINALTWQINCC